ncbi:hypothetical protein Lal_00022503, partial [Lupinus albus]
EPYKNVLRVRHSNLFGEEPLLDELLNMTGFSNFSRLRCFNIDPSLITAIVERWRPETHTFHLPCGECTITLEDVSLQLGLNVNGRPITGPKYFDWDEMCGELLGKVPIVEEDMRGLITLVNSPLTYTNTITTVLYLHLLRDISRVNRYSLGSACLANLYREMCRATKPNGKAMGECLILLQSWAWYKLHFLAPRLDGPPTYPLAKRRGQTNLIFQGVPRGDLTGYSFNGCHMRLISTISTVKFDKIRGCGVHFGLVQNLPQPPMNLGALHRVDKRGNQDANWASKHAQWIGYWSHRRDQVLRGPQIQYPVHTPQYMIWYITNSRPFLSSET